MNEFYHQLHSKLSEIMLHVKCFWLISEVQYQLGAMNKLSALPKVCELKFLTHDVRSWFKH